MNILSRAMKTRDVIKIIENDGWHLVRTKGSHRQSEKGGSDDCGEKRRRTRSGNVEQHIKTGRFKMKNCLVVFERTNTGYSSYSPVFPGCVATGRSRKEVEQNMKEALEFHIEGLKSENLETQGETVYSKQFVIDV